MTDQERQAQYAAIERYKEKLKAEGIKAISIRVPEGRIGELRAIAAQMRAEHRGQ